MWYQCPLPNLLSTYWLRPLKNSLPVQSFYIFSYSYNLWLVLFLFNVWMFLQRGPLGLKFSSRYVCGPGSFWGLVMCSGVFLWCLGELMVVGFVTGPSAVGVLVLLCCVVALLYICKPLFLKVLLLDYFLIMGKQYCTCFLERAAICKWI